MYSGSGKGNIAETWQIEHSIPGHASDLNRMAERRGDEAGLRADPALRVMRLHKGEVALEDGALAWGPLPKGAPFVFLGGEDGRLLGATVSEGGELFDLREHLAALSPRDAELAATARALLSWHHRHGFCAACGAPSRMVDSGWRRVCDACGASHFPRTDPVVIMLVTHGDDVLIGRSPGWPERMYSLLAGFVEPGETVENAVRRETAEEAGVKVGAVRYLASQPWPFPASLMLGCRAEALTRDITVDPTELEHALWISREELAQVFADQHPDIRPPRRAAIAGALMWNFLAGRV